MVRLSTRKMSDDELPSLDEILGPSTHKGNTIQPKTPRENRVQSDRNPMKGKLQTPRRRHVIEDDESDVPKTVVKREPSKVAESLVSTLAGLKLEPSDNKQATVPAARRSPRKAAPRQRAYFIHDSIDLGADSTTADENGDKDEDDSDLSDFVVNDSASEAELRRPPRSLRKTQEMQKTPRRLVRRLHMKKPPSIFEDTDEDVKTELPKTDPEAIDLTSLSKRPSTGYASGSDKENSGLDSRDATLDLTKRLDKALRFSPPSDKAPRASSETHTPPLSPSRPRLQSPTRNRVYIPTSPHRQSIDAFWNQGAVDQWNDVHSPKKTPRPQGRLLPLLLSPSKNRSLQEFVDSESEDSGYESPSAPSPKKISKSPAKGTVVRDRAAMDEKKKFEAEKHELASKFLAELDSTITGGEIARLSASTGGVKIEWNKKLNSTAGRAKWKREKTRVSSRSASSSPDLENIEPALSTKSGTNNNNKNTELSSITGSSPRKCSSSIIIHHHASIELASKVISDRHRLHNVLAHEFCHLTTFMISAVKDNPHGREFKSWAARVSAAFADRDVIVTTKHSYDIDYKYVWACTTCATEYKRHSKSIDVRSHACSACKGSLLQIRPPPRTTTAAAAATAVAGGAGTVSTGTGYNAFVKANFAHVKAELAARGAADGGPATSPALGEVTAELAKRWKTHKAARECQRGDSRAEAETEPQHQKPSSARHPGNGLVDAVTSHLGSLLLGPTAAC